GARGEEGRGDPALGRAPRRHGARYGDVQHSPRRMVRRPAASRVAAGAARRGDRSELRIWNLEFGMPGSTSLASRPERSRGARRTKAGFDRQMWSHNGKLVVTSGRSAAWTLLVSEN